MNILFFTRISPFPINGGERIRSYGLLKVLSELGHNVIAVVSNRDKVDFEDYKLKNVKYFELNNRPFTLLERITGNYYYYTSNNICEVLIKLKEQYNFHLAFLDYAFIGQYVGIFKKSGIPVVYGTHNVESSLLLQEPVRGIFKNLRKYQFYLQAYWHEKFFFPKADKLICVSEDDSLFYSSYIMKDKIHVIPNFLDETRYIAKYKKEDYFVMTANFNAYMNKMGLKWIVEEVWDKSMDGNHKLILVGKGSKEAFEEVLGDKTFKNIIPIGAVDDMVPYIAKAKAVLIPLLQGSGSRLKCLEAMALKTSIITTSKGVEGTVGQGFIVADSPSQFREAISNFITDKERDRLLYESFLANYSLSRNKLRIKGLLEEL
ncbi:glycosyltransferase family 4 protein [Maribacter sp.]|uniref:glycosyltransferase family 4 protein n=1 Tax=Maribacter sp. TaxID=1897614 RepID=UPI003299D051